MTHNGGKASTGFGIRTASKKLSGRNPGIRPRIKVAIVRLTLWGALSITVAEWLIQRGVLQNV